MADADKDWYNRQKEEFELSAPPKALIKSAPKKTLTEKPAKKPKAAKPKKQPKAKKEPPVKKTGVWAIDEEKEKRLQEIADEEAKNESVEEAAPVD